MRYLPKPVGPWADPTLAPRRWSLTGKVNAWAWEASGPVVRQTPPYQRYYWTRRNNKRWNQRQIKHLNYKTSKPIQTIQMPVIAFVHLAKTYSTTLAKASRSRYFCLDQLVHFMPSNSIFLRWKKAIESESWTQGMLTASCTVRKGRRSID